MIGMNATGVQMLLRAMGVDPALIAQKAQEFEQLAKQFGAQIASDVSAMNARLGNIESSLVDLHNKLDAINDGGTYAGPSQVHLLAAPVEAHEHTQSDMTVEHDTKESKTHGRRTTSVTRTHRSNRKAS